MWAIRKASFRINSQPFLSVLLCARHAKVEPASSSYTNTGFGVPPSNLSDSFGLLKTLSWDKGTQRLFMGIHTISSHANLQNVENASDYELLFEAEMFESENELDLLDTAEEVARDSNAGRRDSSDLFKVLVNSPLNSVQKALSKWIEEGRDLSSSDISHLIFELRRRRMYGKALKLSEWLVSEDVEFGERDYASCLDLIFKIEGIHKAEAYLEKIPCSFAGKLVYGTLLANCVSRTLITKAEDLYHIMIAHNSFGATTFTFNQMLLLYTRTHVWKKVDMVLQCMRNSRIKASLITYRILIESERHSKDITLMEKVFERMKSEGLEPDLRLQAVLARQYVYAGIKEKAREILKEMEGSNLNENRRACSSLLVSYALLESYDDVKRVWAVCESNPQLVECMKAIEAFGKLNKVEEAEAVFDRMSKKWEKLSAKDYTSLLKLYANNKMPTKVKDLVKQMIDSGFRDRSSTWDDLVELYVESGQIERADWALSKASQQIHERPLFKTYMMLLDQYAKRGDVHNAEQIFHRMRYDGYVSRPCQYNSLLQAYLNANVPAYGFRERLKADTVFWGEPLVAVAKLNQVEAMLKLTI